MQQHNSSPLRVRSEYQIIRVLYLINASVKSFLLSFRRASLAEIKKKKEKIAKTKKKNGRTIKFFLSVRYTGKTRLTFLKRMYQKLFDPVSNSGFFFFFVILVCYLIIESNGKRRRLARYHLYSDTALESTRVSFLFCTKRNAGLEFDYFFFFFNIFVGFKNQTIV